MILENVSVAPVALASNDLSSPQVSFVGILRAFSPHQFLSDTFDHLSSAANKLDNLSVVQFGSPGVSTNVVLDHTPLAQPVHLVIGLH